MLTDCEISIVKQLAIEGKWTSYIENVLKLRKGSLKHKIEDSNLRDLIIANTIAHTNKNLKLLNLQFLKTRRKDILNYGTNVTLLLNNKACGSLRISKILDITRRQVNKIVDGLGLTRKLKAANQEFKKQNIRNAFYLKRIQYLNDFEYTYKDELCLDVKSGMIYGELCSKYGITLYNLHDIIKRLDLTAIVDANSKEKQRINRINASIAGANKVRGTTIIRHPLTRKMKNAYYKYVRTDIVDSEARSDFFKKFGTVGPNTWAALQGSYGVLRKNPSRFLPGEFNKMFGKEPSKNAGIGIKGHLHAFGEMVHFRSSLELRVYLYLVKNNIIFCLSKHKIQYFKDEKLKNYHPDIVIGECIYEIKPSALIKQPINQLKFNALTDYAKKINLNAAYITYETYDLSEIKLEYILNEIKNGNIIMNDTQINRLSKNIK